MGIVICKIPKAGLGNQLFPIMRAYTFAHLNQLPILVYNYHQVKIGPWLRGEKSKVLVNAPAGFTYPGDDGFRRHDARIPGTFLLYAQTG